MRLINRIAAVSAPLLAVGTKVSAECTAAEKANGCVDLITPKTTSIGAIIVSATNFILGLVGAIAVLFIIWAGIQYITAGGNKDNAEKAKKTLTYAVFGLIVIVLARVIVGLVTNTLGTLF